MARSAILFFCLVFVICLQNVLGENCMNVEAINSCDVCIRCGLHWCNDNDGNARCSSGPCEGSPKSEPAPIVEELLLEGGVTVRRQEYAKINVRNEMTVTYLTNVTGSLVKASMLLVEEDYYVIVTMNGTECSEGQCITTILTTPKTTFCRDSVTEYLQVKLVFEKSVQTNVTYRIKCACECSNKMTLRSKTCNNQGTYSCGLCECNNGWTGRDCSTQYCPATRGDVFTDDDFCLGNGEYRKSCGHVCDCYKNVTGWQYFDDKQNCLDLCHSINLEKNISTCLRDPPAFGSCDGQQFQPFNETLMGEIDDQGRYEWVKCTAHLADDCDIEYVAKKEDKVISIMVVSNCNPTVLAISDPFKVTISIVVAVLGILAAAGTLAGYMIHRSRLPPQVPFQSQYDSLDSKGCVEENPLYKPPTSSFKNPTYGKC